MRKVLVALATLSVVLSGLGLWAVFGQTTDTAQADVTTTFVVTSEDLVSSDKCESTEFLWDSVDSSNHLWSDSVSGPFEATEAEGMYTEFLLELCGNPTLLRMVVEGWSGVPVGDTTIGELNPWMGEFVEKWEKEGVYSFLYKDGDDNIFVNSYFQEVAAKTRHLLNVLVVVGVETATTVENWHIPATNALAVDEFPVAVRATEQYKGEFLVLESREKAGKCLFRIGFNTSDKRFARLACEGEEVAEETTPVTTEPTSESTTPSDDSNTPPSDEPEEDTPSDTPKEKSSNKEDYAHDSEKEIVDKVTTPAETTPPAVETESPGQGDESRDVVDTPTNEPGSESGVVAPGATPEPTTPATTESTTPSGDDSEESLPENQGGDNSSDWDNGGF